MPSYDVSALRFMIVDDSPFMVKILTVVLESLGSQNVLCLHSSANVFKNMEDWKPDLIICDQIMQPIYGLDLIRKIRHDTDSPNRYIPIILLTGHTEAEIVRQARWHAGADAVLVKPVSAGRLIDCIASIYKSERIFVKVQDYFGPDRRNTDRPFEGEDRRQSEIDRAAKEPEIDEEHVLL